MNLKEAISNANKVLPTITAEAHVHVLTAQRHFKPASFDVAGARELLFHLDRCAVSVPHRTQQISTLRADLVAAISAVGGDATPHHEHATTFITDETCARISRAIRVRLLDGPSYASPNSHPGGMGHETFDASREDADYLRSWLAHLANEDQKRGDPGRVEAWRTLHAQLGGI